MQRLFQELVKNEYRRPSAGYLKLKRELSRGETRRLDGAMLREFDRAEKAGRKPRVDHGSYGAAVSWLLKAFPLGKYDAEKNEFEGEPEVYHPVAKVVAKHEIITACTRNAQERRALNRMFNRIYSAKHAGAESAGWKSALSEFVDDVGFDRSREILSKPLVFRPRLMDKLGDKKLLSAKALKLAQEYGLKPDKSFVRHLYAQGMMAWHGFYELAGLSLESMYKKK
jgi:hypothetical protein